MPHHPFVILVALFFTVGMPVIYLVIKARAAALDNLFARRLSPALDCARFGMA
ncbi:MAG: hypothetical protein ACJ74W_17305 [Pyrinomonadaceae bacterium]